MDSDLHNRGRDLSARRIAGLLAFLVFVPFFSSASAQILADFDSPRFHLDTRDIAGGMHLHGFLLDRTNGRPINQVTISLTDGALTKTGTTDENGFFQLSNLEQAGWSPGQYGLALDHPCYWPDTLQVDLEIGTSTPAHAWLESKVVLLVHGINSSGGAWSQEWAPGESFVSVLEDGGQGFEVEAVTFDDSCVRIATNAMQLQEVVDNRILGQLGARSFSIVAHSAGGLVSRFMLGNGDKAIVDKLVMLATPNHGTTVAFAGKHVPYAPELVCNFFSWQGEESVIPDLSSGGPFIDRLNYGDADYPNENPLCGQPHDPEILPLRRRDHIYSIAGTISENLIEPSNYRYAELLVARQFLGFCPNDGVVPSSSARFWNSPDENFWTDTDLGTWAIHYELPRDPAIAQAVRQILLGSPPGHPDKSASKADGVPGAFLQLVNRNLAPGDSTADSCLVPACPAVSFAVSSPIGSPFFSVETPSGTVIDTYTVPIPESLIIATSDRITYFGVTDPEPGLWLWTVANDPSGEAGDFLVVISAEDGLEFTAQVVGGAEPYTDFRCLADLRASGTPLPHGAVDVSVLRPDSTTVALMLRDDGTGGDAAANDGQFFGLVPNEGLVGAHQFTFNSTVDSTNPGAGTRVEEVAVPVAPAADLAVEPGDMALSSGEPEFGTIVLITGTVRNLGAAASDLARVRIVNERHGLALLDTVLSIPPSGQATLQAEWLAADPDTTWFSMLVSAADVGERTLANNSQFASAVTSYPEPAVSDVPEDETDPTLPPGSPDPTALGAGFLSTIAPNPFNARSTIRFEVRVDRAEVELALFDLAGRRVRTLVNGPQSRGVYEVVWDGVDARGRTCSSGVYLCRLQVGQDRSLRKVTVIK